MRAVLVNKPKQIGTACETAVARYGKANGFPDAERLVLHGALDEGDIQLCRGVVVEVKGGHAAETASDAVIASWLAEAEVERRNRAADVCPLVTKRKGKGAANAGSWWAYLPGWAYCYLAEMPPPVYSKPDDFARRYEHAPAVRITLAELATLLRRAGYGDPVT